MLQAEYGDAQRAFDIIRTVLVSAGEGYFTVFHAAFREYFFCALATTPKRGSTDTTIRSRRFRTAYSPTCAQWPEHRNRYALRYYAEHLLEAKRRDELFALADNAAFRQAQVKEISEEPDVPLQTVRMALSAAAECDDAAAMAKFLRQLQLLTNVAQESPLDAVRAGALERAWQLADFGDKRLRTFWYLLLSWELKDINEAEKAQATLNRLSATDTFFPDMLELRNNPGHQKSFLFFLNKLIGQGGMSNKK